MTKNRLKDLGPTARMILDASLAAPVVPLHRVHFNALAAALRATATALLPTADPADPCCALIDCERNRVRRAMMEAASELEVLDYLA